MNVTTNPVNPPKARREPRALDALVPFPAQGDYFDVLSEADLKALADDIKKHGLKQLIEVLPPNAASLPENTILCGHQRARALRRLGRTEVEVRVRYDLASESRETVEAVFLRDNLNRRQLDPLAKARAAARLFEGERRRGGMESLRDRVGKTLGMSGRNLDRYMSLLRAPLAVQNAFRAGKLSLVLAARLGGASQARWDEAERRIESGENPGVVAREVLGAPARDGASDLDFGPLRRWSAAARDQAATIPAATLRRNETTLREAAAVIEKLLVRAQAGAPKTTASTPAVSRQE
jgi:ParB-like chromosome segregation protein Spo0J